MSAYLWQTLDDRKKLDNRTLFQLFKSCQKVDLKFFKIVMAVVRVPQMWSTGGGQFGQDGQKLHENYKIGILEWKQWRGTWGGQANFSGSGGYTALNTAFRINIFRIEMTVNNGCCIRARQAFLMFMMRSLSCKAFVVFMTFLMFQKNLCVVCGKGLKYSVYRDLFKTEKPKIFWGLCPPDPHQGSALEPLDPPNPQLSFMRLTARE